MPQRETNSQNDFFQLESSAQVFLGAVILLGLLAIGRSVYVLYSEPVPSQWFLLAALTLLSGSITIKLPSIPATLSVSETFVFTSVLLFGTAAGTITVTLDGLIISLWLQRRNLELHKLLFNTTAPALSIWIAAEVFSRLTGGPPLNQSTNIAAVLPSLLIFAVVYFLLNSWLMATAVSLEQTLTPLQVWRQNFLWLSLSFLSGASVSILLVSISREINLSALAVIVPLLVISYLTYHTSMGRVEDANHHVDKLNQLYLSTIETLAMAVDAKDQVTHGHIRRVQDRSVCLARYLGVNDDRLIRAVEAASLLHDMGKLAIPEQILNKPGKLTRAEFNVMKTHASVGADILAAIEFPYPVVPIVRHHHENWDGSGYPDGLSGTDIPIGARILSVVDCFDALTSDRPYRPKLPVDEALAILKDRRGTMYDPLVVDAFLEMAWNVPPSDTSHNTESHPVADLSLGNSRMSVQSNRPVPLLGGESFVANDCPTKHVLPYGIEVLANYLTRNSGTLLVLYMLDTTACNLIAEKAWGRQTGSIDRTRIPLGKSLSGSIATAGKAVFDANPASDLANDSGFFADAFTSCDVVPIAVNASIVGVLTLYRNPLHDSGDFPKRVLVLTTEQLSSFIVSRLPA
ncbi:MAG TPA: HD domain-containing phosphohydrolase [Vicinamibacterales bacterium]|nr:HD domain-containing phosphohydrolase [Vicinamibacterales bacterium]